MTDFDRWLTTNPADNDPRVIDFRTWEDELTDEYPFEETNCQGCGRAIGGHLTHDDQPVYDVIVVTPDEEVLCEDCAFEEVE